MMLFIFEGEITERVIFDTIRRLFLKEKNNDFAVCSYRTNIYELYQKMTEASKKDGMTEEDAELFSRDVTEFLQESEIEYKGEKRRFKEVIKRRDEVSEIFLFFDLDPQNNSDPNYTVRCLKKMLKFFQMKHGMAN